MKPRRVTQHASALASARAALLLSALLLGVSLPALPPRPPVCDHPMERVGGDALSLQVACSGAPRPDAPVRGPARLLFGLRLNLNQASARSLEALPEIGPSRAAAIVAARSEAPFHSVAELRRVSGIGPRTLEALEPWVEVESRGLSAD